MWVFKKVADLQAFIEKQRLLKKEIGFVPTMGALHNGHISLINRCKSTATLTVCSIFVNPTQFNDKNDLAKYPRTIANDIVLLTTAGCDVLFLPDVEEIYPMPSTKQYNIGSLDKLLEGSFRPGHFQGVCQVVDRLFDIVNPIHVFFGQKDYQQCMVINRLIEITPQFHHIKMHIVPTLREETGLAMSSRNMLLSLEERSTATVIYKTLLYIKNNLKDGNLSALQREATIKISGAGLQPEYVSIANAQTLEPVLFWDGKTVLVALVAAYLGKIRLIDNLIITDWES
ncbi:MAG: pantoate--beta-alanine ligase [Niabella sp.]